MRSRQRIDLLCEEVTKNRKGDLVAIEVKRGDPSYDVVPQLDSYLDALAKHPRARDRRVRGLIISGPDTDARSSAATMPRNTIDWYYYSVDLREARPTLSPQPNPNFR